MNTQKTERGWRGTPDLWLETAYDLLVEGGVEAVKVMPLAERLVREVLSGAGFEIERNKFWAVMTLAGALLLTAGLWLYIVMVRGA